MASGKPVVGGAAGAVVTMDVEPNTIVGGVPAKVIKKIEIKDKSVTMFAVGNANEPIGNGP